MSPLLTALRDPQAWSLAPPPKVRRSWIFQSRPVPVPAHLVVQHAASGQVIHVRNEVGDWVVKDPASTRPGRSPGGALLPAPDQLCP